MNRRGFSIVELLVAMGIIGVLSAIILPAVMGAREAGRRMQCKNHLKQIGTALANYESQYGTLPMGGIWRYELLPYIDQLPIYRSLNLDGATPDEVWGKVEREIVTLFLCPSDPMPAQHSGYEKITAGSNYHACFGTGVSKHGWNGMFRRIPPPDFDSGTGTGYIRLADVTDGLSNTVAASECLRASGSWSSLERLRVIWQLPDHRYLATEYEALANACDSVPIDATSYGYRGDPLSRGYPWYNGDCGIGIYNHILTPNRPTCWNGTHVSTGVYTAASSHRGGVNCLWGDGRVTFESESIDRGVWRNLASRAESVP